MAYADYDFYRAAWYGDVLPEDAAPKWLERASEELDALTFGRLAEAFPYYRYGIELRIRKAVCAVAEALFYIDAQRSAVSASQAEDGSYRGAVASLSSGRESISYATNNTGATVYARAAASTDAKNALVREIAAKYLANTPDARGVNLLYAGGR